jgi:hypothetical protein
MNTKKYSTQNDLLYNNLMEFYKIKENLDRMLSIINGESKVSLRIVDWFVTNYSKKYYTLYNINHPITGIEHRFKVYNDYKLKLKAYQKRRFDPFCRWERITIPYDNTGTKHIQTTLGQLNFFKWAIENKVINYIEEHYKEISEDQENRGSSSRKKELNIDASKTRKKREELSILASKSIKKEEVEIVVKFT